MKKTTNGGINWFKLTTPSGGILVARDIGNFYVLNKDTIWAAGARVNYGGGSPTRASLFRTVNGGINWQFQIPDTSFNIYNFYFINFTSKNNGWAYMFTTGVHTTLGGDTTWLTGIMQISNIIPKEFKLYQNYPNPFNPRTIIKYQITNNSNVSLIVYDITGKEILSLVNEKQPAGAYNVDFSGNGLSSGIYFYSLLVDNKLIDTKKMILIK